MEPGRGPFHSKEGFWNFVKNHKVDAIAYLLLFIGLIVTIFHRVAGGLMVGLILGVYFSLEIQTRMEQFKEFIDREGIFRGFIVIAALLALLISNFGLVIGAAAGVFLRPLFGDSISSPFDDSDR